MPQVVHGEVDVVHVQLSQCLEEGRRAVLDDRIVVVVAAGEDRGDVIGSNVSPATTGPRPCLQPQWIREG